MISINDAMTSIMEQIVLTPDAIEQFCASHDLLKDSVMEWISDYRAFTLTRKIKRREQFFEEFDRIASAISGRV
jgi:hypothetical protein